MPAIRDHLVVMERDVNFQQALSWLHSHLGDEVALSVRAASERSHRNWGVHAEGVLHQGPGERQLVDSLGGVVRDFLIGQTRVQLVEDDLRRAVIAHDGDESLDLDVGGAQINFWIAK